MNPLAQRDDVNTASPDSSVSNSTHVESKTSRPQSQAPVPQAPVDPNKMLDNMESLSREDQITAFERIHRELAARLNRAQM